MKWYIHTKSWKQCALPVITTMALWQLMHLGTWPHDERLYIYYIFKLVKDNLISVDITMFYWTSFRRTQPSCSHLHNFLLLLSPKTGKRVKDTLSTSVREHMLDCDHTVDWEDFSIIGRESNNYLLETKESLFIQRENPSLNRSKYSQELLLS